VPKTELIKRSSPSPVPTRGAKIYMGDDMAVVSIDGKVIILTEDRGAFVIEPRKPRNPAYTDDVPRPRPTRAYSGNKCSTK
jgi:hypothetical protein